MMKDWPLNSTALRGLKSRFPQGCRVRLVRMDDPHAPAPGTEGTVIAVDDVGTVHVSWDNGSGLGVVYGVDVCTRIA